MSFFGTVCFFILFYVIVCWFETWFCCFIVVFLHRVRYLWQSPRSEMFMVFFFFARGSKPYWVFFCGIMEPTAVIRRSFEVVLSGCRALSWLITTYPESLHPWLQDTLVGDVETNHCSSLEQTTQEKISSLERFGSTHAMRGTCWNRSRMSDLDIKTWPKTTQTMKTYKNTMKP